MSDHVTPDSDSIVNLEKILRLLVRRSEILNRNLKDASDLLESAKDEIRSLRDASGTTYQYKGSHNKNGPNYMEQVKKFAECKQNHPNISNKNIGLIFGCTGRNVYYKLQVAKQSDYVKHLVRTNTISGTLMNKILDFYRDRKSEIPEFLDRVVSLAEQREVGVISESFLRNEGGMR